MTPEDQITRARIDLLYTEPFFAHVLFKLRLEITTDIETACTDGRRLRINPLYFASLSEPEQKALLAHEALHVMLFHMTRIGARDLGKWNRAADYAINAELKRGLFTLGAGWLYDARYDGMSAESIYAQLPDNDGSDGMGPGGVEPAPSEDGTGPASPAEIEELEAQIKVATIAAAQAAKNMGKESGLGTRLAEEHKNPLPDWRERLAHLARQRSNEDFRFSRPNPRFVSQGIYLPERYSESLGPMVFGIDVSGSVSPDELAQYSSECNAIAQEARPECVHVVYFDSRVQHTERHPGGEPFKLESVGGGGTDFRPVFDWIDAQAMDPAALIMLTDLYGPAPDSPPPYPVIWACTSDREAPFGDLVRLSFD